jgi:hypothetical protein
VRGEIFLAEPSTRDAVDTLPSRGSVPACKGGVNAIRTQFHDLVSVEPDAGAVCAGVAEGEGAASKEGEVDFLGDESHVGSDFAEVFKSGWSGASFCHTCEEVDEVLQVCVVQVGEVRHGRILLKFLSGKSDPAVSVSVCCLEDQVAKVREIPKLVGFEASSESASEIHPAKWLGAEAGCELRIVKLDDCSGVSDDGGEVRHGRILLKFLSVSDALPPC